MPQIVTIWPLNVQYYRKKKCFVNPFVLNAPFIYPLKTSENDQVFKGVEKGFIGNERVNTLLRLSWQIQIGIHLPFLFRSKL